MPRYRRVCVPGGTYFFTVVTHKRRPIFSDDGVRALLRRAIEETRQRRPFEVVAMCLLPDHLHCIWSLPEDDCDYSTRWSCIKGAFTRKYLARCRRVGQAPPYANPSRRRTGEAAVWQRRFWGHLVTDEDELSAIVDYIHYNPVKHGLATRVADWPWSTFERYVKDGVYDLDWGGDFTADCVDIQGVSE